MNIDMLSRLVLAATLMTYAGAGFSASPDWGGLIKGIISQVQTQDNQQTSQPKNQDQPSDTSGIKTEMGPSDSGGTVENGAQSGDGLPVVPANVKPKNYVGFLPVGWNDLKYSPDVLDGSFHLRLGSNGTYLKQPNVGPPTCDLVYLYYANTPKEKLSGDELEYCALNEYFQYKTITGDDRNMNDGFVRQDTINLFSKVALKRLAQIKEHKEFYIRSAAITVDPYNFNTKAFPIHVNMFGCVTDPPQGKPISTQGRIFYGFAGKGISSGFLTANLSANPDLARDMEAARAHSGGFLHGMNEVHFKVLRTHPATQDNGNDGRAVEVKIAKFITTYIRPDNKMGEVGFGF